MNEQAEKIAAAEQKCIALAVGHSDQLGCIYRYVNSLRDHSDSTEAELIDVQVRMIHALMTRIREGDED